MDNQSQNCNWISVKEQLPEPTKRVIVCITYPSGEREITISTYEERAECFDHFFTDLITHWQPLMHFPKLK